MNVSGNDARRRRWSRWRRILVVFAITAGSALVVAAPAHAQCTSGSPFTITASPPVEVWCSTSSGGLFSYAGRVDTGDFSGTFVVQCAGDVCPRAVVRFCPHASFDYYAKWREWFAGVDSSLHGSYAYVNVSIPGPIDPNVNPYQIDGFRLDDSVRPDCGPTPGHGVFGEAPNDTSSSSGTPQPTGPVGGSGLYPAGVAHQIYGDGDGWHNPSTGKYLASGPFSAVNMGGQWPQVMLNENGQLYQFWADQVDWHHEFTGITVPAWAPISAVNMGGQWPQVMVNVNGVLHQVWADPSGWHIGSTGIGIPAGVSISAVNMGGQWPQVMVNVNGVLHQVWADPSGWHIGSTGIGIPTGSPMSAVNMGGGWPQVMVNVGGVLHQVWAVPGSWNIGSTGIAIPSGAPISAVNMGGGWPQVMVNANGALQQVWAVPGSWNIGFTGVYVPSGRAVSAVNMGAPWPQVMMIE